MNTERFPWRQHEGMCGIKSFGDEEFFSNMREIEKMS